MATTAPADSRNVTVELPIGEVNPDAYRSVHVEVTNMTALQKESLRRILEGLQSNAVRLKSGRIITGSADAVRYILERIGEEAGLNGH